MGMKARTKAQREWCALYRELREAMAGTVAAETTRAPNGRITIGCSTARYYLRRYFAAQPGGKAAVYAWAWRQWTDERQTRAERDGARRRWELSRRR